MTVEAYIAELPEDRQDDFLAVRNMLLENLPDGISEGTSSGMISYFVPFSIYLPGYHCDVTKPLPFAGLASQKNHMALYLMGLYPDSEAEKKFQEAYAKTGKKLDMGKSCIRFDKVEDLALDVIVHWLNSMSIDRYIHEYEKNLQRTAAARRKAKSRVNA